MVAVDEVVKSLKESDNELANAVEYYASVLHTKLQLRCVFILYSDPARKITVEVGPFSGRLGTPHAWKLVFDRLTHRDLHDVQLVCRSFRSIVRPLIRHAPMEDVVVRAQLAPWRHVWAVQCGALRPRSTPTDQAPIATVELVDHLDACCGSAPIPRLVICGDAAPLDHPQLLECVARHDVVELVLGTDFSGLAYEPLRRFLQSWKRIEFLTISAPNDADIRTDNAADIVCVSDDLLRDAAACGIEKVSIRCERAAGITDEGMLDFWLSATSRKLDVIGPAISQDFIRRLVQSTCSLSDAHNEADLTIYAAPNDVLQQLDWEDYFDHRMAADLSGTTHEFAAKGVVLEMKISLNKYCPPKEVASGRAYDVLRITRRPGEE